MIHPNTELRFISEDIGYGVFATGFIPKGAITYVKDSLEIVVSPTDFLLYEVEMKKAIEKYSYKDEYGFRIISWDFAKYVNHSCNCNSISTGYGFEIAIRDIQPGEQLTDEYSIFNLDHPFECGCGSENCRKTIFPADFEKHYKDWDKKIKKSLKYLFKVDQPLLPLIDIETRATLNQFFQQPAKYKSVYSLRLKELPGFNQTNGYQELEVH
ncbi:SET domain-containing protein [Flexithrix dorotheae]|uniref:SET domain-containing protein n=1 Tax=Flexithrix dorotheae TaxID=70993 RepID=UPI000361EDA2|nr:SET domain-containing protein-lysine N-methyltransferase [Flexithrix dorotheae]